MRYPVTITKDDNDTFLVTFPDVPGAITYGKTKEDALAHAVDALLTIFDARMRDREELPAPSERAGAAVDVPPLEAAKIELYRTMRAEKVNKTELAKRLNWHLPQVDRVLNVRHESQLDQLSQAFNVLGKRLVLTTEPLRAKAAASRVTNVVPGRATATASRSRAAAPRATAARRRQPR